MVAAEMKLPITGLNGRMDGKNGDAVLEATVSLADLSVVDTFFKKMLSDKRIYDVHRQTTLS